MPRAILQASTVQKKKEEEEEEAGGFNPVLTTSDWSWLGGYDWTVQNQKRNGPWHPPS